MEMGFFLGAGKAWEAFWMVFDGVTRFVGKREKEKGYPNDRLTTTSPPSSRVRRLEGMMV